jgi:hypothetical protein
MTAGFPEPAVLIGSEAEAGRVLRVVHPLRLNKRGLAGFGVAALFLPVVVLIVAEAGNVNPVVPVLYMLAGSLVIVGLILWAFTGTRIRICEHGLIVSTMAGKWSRFYIPYATIDPGSVMVHPVPRRGGAYRYKPITAMTRRYPWPAMRQLILATCPVFPRINHLFPYGNLSLKLRDPRYGQPLNIWGAPYSRHGISFRALHPVFASPWWRARPAVRGFPPRAQWVLSAMRPLLDYPELIPVLIHNDQPVMRWMFGTDRPEWLLRQIEDAMVAAQVPDAEGFTARALAHPYDRPPKDIPADPQLW